MFSNKVNQKVSVFTAKKLAGFSFPFPPVAVCMSFSLSASLFTVCSVVNTKCHNHKIFQETSASCDDKQIKHKHTGFPGSEQREHQPGNL